MIDEIRGLLDQYAQWVRDKSVLREVNDQYVEITTSSPIRSFSASQGRMTTFRNSPSPIPSERCEGGPRALLRTAHGIP